MWISTDVNVPTARLMAADILRKKRLAFHVTSLEMSRVSKEVLEETDLMPALSKHVYHPGIGVAVRGLLDRFMAISQGKKDEVNSLFETMSNPFRKPNERKNSKVRIGKNQIKKEIDTSFSDRVDSPESEDSEVDWSDTDSEGEIHEPCASLPISVHIKQECDVEVIRQPTSVNVQNFDEKHVQDRQIKSEPIEEQNQKSQNLKLKISGEHQAPPKTVRKDQEQSDRYLDSVVDNLVSTIFKEAAYRPKIENKPIKKELIPKFEKNIEKTPKIETVQEIKRKLDIRPVEYAPWLPTGKENTSPKNFVKPERFKKEIQAPKPQLPRGTQLHPIPKNLRNIKKTVEKKGGKEHDKMAKKTKRMTAGLEIFQVSKMKEVKRELEEMPEQQFFLDKDVMALVEKLNVLPLEPSRDQVLSVLPKLNARILSEAEKVIGRKMHRVDRVWWELLLRDFGPIDRSQNAGDVRDIYTAKQMFAERRRLREKAARLPPNPLERVFATLPNQ